MGLYGVNITGAMDHLSLYVSHSDGDHLPVQWLLIIDGFIWHAKNSDIWMKTKENKRNRGIEWDEEKL